jgi:carbon storage regulator
VLILSRRLNEKILIGGDVTLTVTRISGNTVWLGIEAPREIRIDRAEVRGRDERPEGGAP